MPFIFSFRIKFKVCFIFLNYSLIILFRELTNCHYLASSISVFMPFIFSFRIKFKVCFIFLRDTAAKE